MIDNSIFDPTKYSDPDNKMRLILYHVDVDFDGMEYSPDDGKLAVKQLYDFLKYNVIVDINLNNISEIYKWIKTNTKGFWSDSIEINHKRLEQNSRLAGLVNMVFNDREFRFEKEEDAVFFKLRWG